MGQKLNRGKQLLLQVFIMLGLLIIVLQIGANVVKNNIQEKAGSSREVNITDTTEKYKHNEGSYREESKDSIWKDTEFME